MRKKKSTKREPQQTAHSAHSSSLLWHHGLRTDHVAAEFGCCDPCARISLRQTCAGTRYPILIPRTSRGRWPQAPHAADSDPGTLATESVVWFGSSRPRIQRKLSRRGAAGAEADHSLPLRRVAPFRSLG